VPEISGLYREPPRSGETRVTDAKYALEIAFDLSPVGMAVLDEGRGFRMVNEAYCDLVGYPREEILFLRLGDITHPEDRWLDREWRQYVKDERAEKVTRRKRLLTRRGDTIWVTHHSRKSSLGPDSPFFSVSTFKPISDERLAEVESETKAAWTSRINDALSDDRFEIYGQPIVDLRTGRVEQLELLARMNRDSGPEDRLILPAEFMRPAERYGLVNEIDRWVVARAIELARRRKVTVNLSGSTISDQELVEEIERSVRESGAPPENLVFEITETAVVDNLEAAQSFVERLHELGSKFALDDFGTGFGSFSYLKRIPVDYLKIDLDFVRDMVANEADRRVVKAIANTADLFGIDTIAEGVEDPATLELLREIGVDYVQGYHVGRPFPIGQVDPEEEPGRG